MHRLALNFGQVSAKLFSGPTYRGRTEREVTYALREGVPSVADQFFVKGNQAVPHGGDRMACKEG